MPKTPTGHLAQVTGKNISIDPAEHYDGWAESYDRDLLDGYGYCGHEIAARAFAGELDPAGAQVIDVGCGTGLVGLTLAQMRYTAIDGVDVSQGMLAEAAKTQVYRALIWQDADKGPAIAEGTYDGVICAGSFGAGHLGPEAMGRLIRMARPGGPVVIFMNAEPYVDEDYESHVATLERGGGWLVLRIEDYNYMSALERPGKLIVARRTPTG